jgi:hypothetical protein
LKIMKKIEDWFIIHHARSGILANYKPGNVPYLANGLSDNAVATYVTPLDGDKVFKFRAVVVSAFGEATLQMPPFVAYGAAGTSLTVLEPKNPMSNGELAYLAAWLKRAMQGRFNWYFRSIPDRITRIPMPDSIPPNLGFDVKPLLPPKGKPYSLKSAVDFDSSSINELFYVHRAKSGSFAEHEHGNVPFISNGSGTGIVGYVKPLPKEKVFDFIGIVVSALSGATLQVPPFIARGSGGSGLVVLEPQMPMVPAQLLCVDASFNKVAAWRFNWSRQITADQVGRVVISLPVRNGQPDKESATELAKTIPYWGYLSKRLNKTTS